MNEINNLINKTTNKTGCYLLKDKNNHVVYVGKAKNIKKRIQQHYKGQFNNPKAKFMLEETKSWETFITNNEKEAFILENTLIKKHFPKFNIILSDDQTHPYIFISTKNENPKYFLLWKKVKQPGLYYGPFLSKSEGKEILNLLETLFPLRRCKKNKEKKPCFYYHLNQCSGACFKKIPKDYYLKKIKKVKALFNGKVKAIKKKYIKKIEIASQNLQFEQAQKWKNLINKIDQFIENQIVEYHQKNNLDFINFYEYKKEIVIIIFLYRQGKLTLKKEGLFNLFNNDIEETVENFLQEHYTYHPFPQEIVLPKTIKLKSFQENYKIKITYPKIGIKNKILDLITKNAKTLINVKGIQNKQKEKITVLEKLKKIIKSEKKINKIEFLDLSYIDTKNIVAGFTHYLNGNQIFKKNKIYQLKNFSHHNEKKYFEQAINEHYQKNKLPDLLILDGGYTQLAGTQKAFKKMKVKTQIICLVKNENHETNYILKENKKKINLTKNDSLWLFLSKIQNDGHLYVIKNLRNLQGLNKE